MDQSQPPVGAQIDESGEYTHISSAEPVNLSKSKELSEPSQIKGELDLRTCPMLTISPLMRFPQKFWNLDGYYGYYFSYLHVPASHWCQKNC